MSKNDGLKIAVGISGASGSIYAKVILQQLKNAGEQVQSVGVVWSKNAKEVWQYELPNEPIPNGFLTWENDNFSAPIASGSAQWDALIICPCSMGTLGRVANGLSDTLLTRAADVQLKERRKLICVLRETPYNLLQIQNMERLTQSGGIICPASPSFYSLPKTFEALAATVTGRALALCGIDVPSFQWGKTN